MIRGLAIATLLTLSLATLEVYGPDCARDKFNKSVEYTLSNFGEIPYGQTIIGQVKLPSDPQLCDTEDETPINNKDSSFKAILLVERGGCKFTKKVINAQDLGADLIIIYDNIPSEHPAVIMKNDGHGHLAEIPSLFLSKTDGEKLKAREEGCALPIVRVHFEMDQAKISQVTLWLDANNRETFILARDFHKNEYYDILKDRIELDVRFRVEKNCQSWICSQEDCVGAKTEKYCRNVLKPDNKDFPYTKGQDIVMEQLREYFLWEALRSGNERELWWRYMTKFDHNICLSKQDVLDCSLTTMRELGLPEATIASVQTQSEAERQKAVDQKPSLLKQSVEEAQQAGIYFYPEVTINDRNFYGLFKAPEVFEAICDSLLDPPGQCISFVKENHQDVYSDDTGGLWKTIMIILFVMTLGFLVALFVYTKVIKREVSQQLSVEVNTMVEKYVNLANKKGSNTGSSYSKFDS